MDEFEEGYDRFCDGLPAAIAAERSAEWVDSINREVHRLEACLEQFSGTGAPIDSLAGDVAEYLHAGTYNINRAVARDDGPVAVVPRSHGFGSADVELVDGAGSVVEKYQAKYYATAEKSARAQALTFGEASKRGRSSAAKAIASGEALEGDQVYGGSRRLVAEDQLDKGLEWLERRAAKEASARPGQVARYRDTASELCDRVDGGRGCTSDGLTKDDSRDVAEAARSGRFKPSERGLSAGQKIDPGALLRDSAMTGAYAAALAAALELAPTAIESIRSMATGGTLDTDLLRSEGAAALRAGGRGFVSGTAAAAVTTAARSGMVPALAGLGAPALATLVAVTSRAIEGGVDVAIGRTSADAFAASLSRDAAVLALEAAAGAAGQALVPVPYLGYLLGSLVGSVLGAVALSATDRATVSLGIALGIVLFGRVEGDCSLPESVLAAMGLDCFDFERYAAEGLEPAPFEPASYSFDAFSPERFELGFIRRGVLEVRGVRGLVG